VCEPRGPTTPAKRASNPHVSFLRTWLYHESPCCGYDAAAKARRGPAACCASAGLDCLSTLCEGSPLTMMLGR
jgi:hypothetical protein